MLVQGWNVVNPKLSSYDVQVTIESMQSVKILLKNKGGGGDNLNVYIANGKTYVSKSTTPDETVTLYGVWLPDNYDATNESGMQKPFKLLSPDVDVAVDFSNVVDAIAEKPNPVTVEQLQNKTQEITQSLTNINNGITLLPKQNDIASMTTQVSNLLTTGVFNAKIDETNAKITELQTTFVELKQSIEAGNKVLSTQFDNSFKKVGQTIANSMAIMSASVASFLSQDLEAAQEAKRQAEHASENASEQTSNAQNKLDEARANQEAEAERARLKAEVDRARREAEKKRAQREAEIKSKLQDLPVSVVKATALQRDLQALEPTPKFNSYIRQITAYITLEADDIATDKTTPIVEALKMQKQDVLPWFTKYIFFKALDIDDVEKQNEILTNEWFDSLYDIRLQQFRDASNELLKCITQKNYFFDTLTLNRQWNGILSSIQAVAEGTLLYTKCRLLQELSEWCNTVIALELTYTNKTSDSGQNNQYNDALANLFDNQNNTFLTQIIEQNETIDGIIKILQMFENNAVINQTQKNYVATIFAQNKIAWVSEYVLRWYCESVKEQIDWLEKINQLLDDGDAYKQTILLRLAKIAPLYRNIEQLKTQLQLAETAGDSEEQTEYINRMNQVKQTVQTILFPVLLQK